MYVSFSVVRYDKHGPMDLIERGRGLYIVVFKSIEVYIHTHTIYIPLQHKKCSCSFLSYLFLSLFSSHASTRLYTIHIHIHTKPLVPCKVINSTLPLKVKFGSSVTFTHDV